MATNPDERMRELRRQRERRRKQVEWEIQQTRRQIDLDRLDAQLYPQEEPPTADQPHGPVESLTLSEISEFPQPGYTHANLQKAIREARSLMSTVAYGPYFNFMSAYQKQEMIARLQIAELKAGLALLRLDPMEPERLLRISDLERQLKTGEDYLRHLTDPSHPIHHEWQSK